jgi:cardiolipin synthase
VVEPWVNIVVSVVAVLAHGAIIMGVLLSEKRQHNATLAWILSIILLPVLGVIIFFLIGRTRARKVKKRSAEAGSQLRALLKDRWSPEQVEHAEEVDPRTPGFLALAKRLSSTMASRGNEAKMLVNATQTYRAMIQAIEEAEHHIHVEFYIIRPDNMGESLRNRLARRAEEGIDVRVLCDGVGSVQLPSDFWDPLEAAGGHAACYHPVSRLFTRFRRRDRLDFRNHRKIVIVDGRVGFTGGINVGREYLGLNPDMGHWRDTHIELRGPSVLSLQATYIEDWLNATGELLDDKGLFPEPERPGKATVQIVDSGPDQAWSPISHALMYAFARADHRIWITSPYFVPSIEISETLISAALRGVDVRLLVPAKADHLIVHLASHWYYRPMLEAGVRIFLYQRGFIHAKSLVADSWLGTIGSANMDMRSFNLNFELNAFVFGTEFVTSLAHQFEEDLKEATELTLEEQLNASLPRRLAWASARLFSPLL